MKYIIYKLYFLNGVHFGKNALENSLYHFYADTLFSALCQEAVKMGEDTLAALVDYVKSGRLILSDAFPFCGEEYYLPKPFLYIEHKEDAGDSAVKKAYRKMKYLPCSRLDEYLRGELSVDDTHGLEQLGHSYRKVSAFVRNEEDTLPYRVGIYYFGDSNGLYVITGTEDGDAEQLLDGLMNGLSKAGIGGKRCSGLGRFDYSKEKVPEIISGRLGGEWDKYVTLSVSLPKETQLKSAIEGAEYSVIKRSGFVSSDHYAEEMRRKRDMYVLAAGSCFRQRFDGDLYDVSSEGRHSVYRYAVPMFMGVDI